MQYQYIIGTDQHNTIFIRNSFNTIGFFLMGAKLLVFTMRAMFVFTMRACNNKIVTVLFLSLERKVSRKDVTGYVTGKESRNQVLLGH